MAGFFGHKDGAEGDDCAPNSDIETMPELALDMLNAFTDHFVRSGKSLLFSHNKNCTKTQNKINETT